MAFHCNDWVNVKKYIFIINHYVHIITIMTGKPYAF